MSGRRRPVDLDPVVPVPGDDVSVAGPGAADEAVRTALDSDAVEVVRQADRTGRIRADVVALDPVARPGNALDEDARAVARDDVGFGGFDTPDPHVTRTGDDDSVLRVPVVDRARRVRSDVVAVDPRPGCGDDDPIPKRGAAAEVADRQPSDQRHPRGQRETVRRSRREPVQLDLDDGVAPDLGAARGGAGLGVAIDDHAEGDGRKCRGRGDGARRRAASRDIEVDRVDIRRRVRFLDGGPQRAALGRGRAQAVADSRVAGVPDGRHGEEQ